MTDAPAELEAAPPPARPATRNRRLEHERRIRRRSAMVAGGSTAAAVLAVVLLVPLAPGWEAVQRSFFNADIFVQTFPRMLQAFMLDIAIFLWCAPAIAVVGLLIALCRDARAPALFPLRLFGIAYTDIFRGIPVILVVYLVGFGVPGLGLQRPWNSPYIWGSLALILTYSAYVAEIFRSGIEERCTRPAGGRTSLGLLRKRRDALPSCMPQAIRAGRRRKMNMLSRLLQKDVALLSSSSSGGGVCGRRCLQVAAGQLHPLRWWPPRVSPRVDTPRHAATRLTSSRSRTERAVA